MKENNSPLITTIFVNNQDITLAKPNQNDDADFEAKSLKMNVDQKRSSEVYQ